MHYTITNLKQAPFLKTQLDQLHDQAWSRFICEYMRTDAAISTQWDILLDRFSEYQILLQDDENHLIAIGHTIPVYWDGTPAGFPKGWEDVLQRGTVAAHPPNILSALAVIVAPDWQGQGISQLVLQRMKQLAAQHHLSTLIAPVRPILKHQYPLTSMQEYISWQRNEQPFDPWIRVHHKLGATVLSVVPQSMVIRASIAQWQDWTGLSFPNDGEYLVPGALHPITINHQENQGIYQEANVWMQHAAH